MLHPKNPYTQKNGSDMTGVVLVASTWLLTGATWVTQANITFCLSTIVSLMAIRHYYLQGKRTKRK